MELERKTIENDETYLRQISTPVDFEKDDLNNYIELLKKYCTKYDLYALAPVQIGIPKRMIYIKNTTSNMSNSHDKNYDENIVYINPVITKSYGNTKFLEGCGSCMYIENGIEIYCTAVIDRPYRIDVEYCDANGKKMTKIIEGFEATVFSHEYDHLNGILHMDKSNEIFKMTVNEMRAYRSEHPYEILSKDDEYICENKKR